MRFFAVLAILAAASPSFATVYLHANLMYQSTSSGQGSTQTSTRQDLDLGAGYVSDKGWVFGVMQGSDSFSLSPNQNRTSMGPTFGWISRKDTGGLYALLTYFLSASRPDELTGSGYQLDFGYTIPFRRITFAPQLTYRSLSYDKSNGQPVSPAFVENRISPGFSFWVMF